MTMNKLILLSVVAYFATACTMTTFKDGESQFERRSFFTFAQINQMTVTITDSKGNKRTLELSGSSDQVQALEKVAEGVAKGIVAGVQP
jgi:hypothetical protein